MGRVQRRYATARADGPGERAIVGSGPGRVPGQGESGRWEERVPAGVKADGLELSRLACQG